MDIANFSPGYGKERLVLKNWGEDSANNHLPLKDYPELLDIHGLIAPQDDSSVFLSVNLTLKVSQDANNLKC
jgi:hypothetical protein